MKSFFKYLDEFETQLDESAKKSISWKKPKPSTGGQAKPASGKPSLPVVKKPNVEVRNTVKTNMKGSKPASSNTPSVTKVGKEVKNTTKTNAQLTKPKSPGMKFTKPTQDIKSPVRSGFTGTKPSEAGKKVSFKSPKNEEKIVMKKKTTQVAESVVSRAQGILDRLPEDTEVTLMNESVTVQNTQVQPKVVTQESECLDKAENLL